MYEQYFGFKRKPFSIVPDPQCFYMSQGHREALAHLLYGVRNDGCFVLLTGEVGTGKTTVCRCLFELMPPETEVAFILHPQLTVRELLATICDEFKIDYPADDLSARVLVARINEYLLDVHARGRKAVLVIEEAQNLSTEALEQIRMLTNLETNEQKLLQIIMLGQPELRQKLSHPSLRQVSQRITARYHLGPLSKEAVSGYVKYRLSVAGVSRGQLFPPGTLKRIYRLTGGVPRIINLVCDRALLGAYVEGKERVDPKTVMTAAREVLGIAAERLPRLKALKAAFAAGLVLVLCAGLGLGYYVYADRSIFGWRTAVVNAGREIGPAPRVDPVKTDPRPPDVLPAQLSMGPRDWAYQALFKQWGIEYAPQDGRTVCDQARARGLQCVEGRMDLARLRQVNRPAVMKLLDEEGKEYYATLTALAGDSATLAGAGGTKTMKVDEVARRWSGDFVLLWRVPPEFKDELQPGNRGPAVAWLDAQLARLQGRAPRPGQEQVYDSELVRQVKKFQLAAHLKPDGIVGPATVMRLSALSADGDPLLQERRRSD